MAIKDFKANLWFQIPFAADQAGLSENAIEEAIMYVLKEVAGGLVMQGCVVFCTGWAPEPSIPAPL